jgi:hypothetical protein
LVAPSPVFGQDPSQAAWVGARLTGLWGHVTGTVPAGFDRYARILHPVEAEADRLVRWSDVAEAAGTHMHPLAQWNRIARRRPGEQPWWTSNKPREGDLVASTLRELLSILRHHTTTPQDTWFCLWTGYGWIHGSPSIAVMVVQDGGTVTERDVPPAYPAEWLNPALEVRHPGREYLLGQGPLDAALGIGHQVTDDWFDAQSPNLFWPADRAWCVATEIDFDSTLVGGSDQLIDDLLATPTLEAWPMESDDSLQADADHIN